MFLYIDISHSSIAKNQINEFRVIISKRYEKLIFYFYPNIPKITIFYNGVKIGPLYLNPENENHRIKLKKILASLNIKNPDLDFFKIKKYIIESNCDDEIVFESNNIKKLNEDMLRIEQRLLSEQEPAKESFSTIEKIGNTFGLFFNIASFIPAKLFEYTVIAGGWELLSDDAKKEKIENAIIDGVLENESLSEQLAEDYVKCTKELGKDRDKSLDREKCYHELTKLRERARRFSKQYFNEFDSMNFENMDKVAKKVRVFLLSEISLKNLKKSSFSQYAPLSFDQKSTLRKSASLVISDYSTCLSKATDDYMVNSCDGKIAVSAPFRIAREVLGIKLDQALSCKVEHEEYLSIKDTAKKQFDSCSENQYFLALDYIKAKEIKDVEEDNKKTNDEEKEKLDSSNIMKACVYSSMLESVKMVADTKVKNSVKEQLEGITIPEELKFNTKKDLNICFEKNELIQKGSNNYDFNALLNLKSDGLRKIIGQCTNELTKKTGADLFKISLENNKEIAGSFYGDKKGELISDIMQRGYKDCLLQYDEPDPAKCAGAAKLIATHKIMEATLKRNIVENTLSDKLKNKLSKLDRLIDDGKLKNIDRLKFLDNVAQKGPSKIDDLFKPTQNILNKCINIVDESVKEKVRMRKLYVSINSNCRNNASANCTQEKIKPELCELANTDFAEEDASYCLKQSIRVLSGNLSKVIIKDEISKNSKLKELGVEFKPKEIQLFENTAKSCYQKLLRCNKSELDLYKDKDLKEIQCLDEGESLNEVQTKIPVIGKRCKNQVYLAVLPEASRKIINKELGNRISDWRIKEVERRITFLKNRNSKNDNEEIESLKAKVLEIDEEIKKKRIQISNELVKDFKDKISKEDNLNSMLAHTDELTNRASLKIIDTIVEDTLDESTDAKRDLAGYNRLKEKINTTILNDEFKSSFLTIKNEDTRNERIKDVRLQLVEQISSYSIKSSLNTNIPKELGTSYRRNLTRKIKKVFSNCLENDPDRAGECGNMATVSATGRIYKQTIEKELKALLKTNEKSFFYGPLEYMSEATRNIFESLDDLSVKKIERKNFHFVAGCLSKINKKLPSIEFSEKSKTCVNLGLLDLSSHAIDMYLNKYDSLLSKEEKKKSKNLYNVCLETIKSDIHKLSFGEIKQTVKNINASFGNNRDVNTQFVKEKMVACTEKFAINLKNSVSTSVLDYLHINDALSFFD